MPDIRKTLDQLRWEWHGCRRCVLGEKRDDSNGRMAFGEGRSGGIFFVGEGPGASEAIEGRPFVGASGTVLRKAINKLGLAECSYISNVVICRSFGPKYDNNGQVMLRLNRRTGGKEMILQDEPPPHAATMACLNRLYEEIYIVDPVLIVALGAEAAKALTHRPVKVTEKRGTTIPINVPGVWSLPDLTNKGAWARRYHGEVNYPTTQNYVEYLMFMTVHPAHVLYRQADRSHGNPMQTFIEDMHFITDIYYRYAKEAFNIDCIRRTQLLPNDIIEDNG